MPDVPNLNVPETLPPGSGPANLTERAAKMTEATPPATPQALADARLDRESA